jgi:hypothetical protein
MNDLRTAAQQALEALELCRDWPGAYDECSSAIAALRAALAQQEQTCNCRWIGDVQTQQCTLHEAHVDAIHEWAERAKTAEAKLAALTQPEQEQGPVEIKPPNPEGATQCIVRWFAETPAGWVGAWYREALERFTAHPPRRETEQEPVALFTKYGPPTERDRDFWSAGYAAGAARAIEQACKERNT